MTFYYSNAETVAPTFVSAGTFIGSAGWTHAHRIIDTYEIICPIRGALPLQIGATQYLARPGTFMIVPPFTEHMGFRPITTALQFDWFHFTLPELAICNASGVSTDDLGAYSLLLPDYSDKLMIDRVYVLTNQLLDINQLKCDRRYRNSLVASILFEVTYQQKQLLQTQQLTHHELQPIHDWIRIHALEPIGLEQIANYFNYNKSYLSRIYKARFHMNITQEIERFRMEAAKSLLVETTKTIDEIAGLVGYNDAKYFMKIFKRSTGITPTRYRVTFHQRHFNRH